MRKIMSSPKHAPFRYAVSVTIAQHVACDAFTELLESLRAKNSEGQAEDAMSRCSTSELFKKWGSTKSTSPNGDSFETITAGFEHCLSELTLMVQFMMKPETGIQGDNFNPIKHQLRTFGGYTGKKKPTNPSISSNELGKKLTLELFKQLNDSAVSYLRVALEKSKNKTLVDSDFPETFQSISGLLESKEDHGNKKIKICQLIQALYAQYHAQMILLFSVSEDLNRHVTTYAARGSLQQDIGLPPKEIVLQLLLLLNPTTSVLPKVFSEKSTLDIRYLLDKVAAKDIVEYYDEATLERLIASLETWSKTPENFQNPEFDKLNTYLKNLYNALVEHHHETCSKGTATSETKLVKVLMKLASVDLATHIMSAKSYDNYYLLTTTDAQDLLFGILDKEIITQKKESTPFRSNTTAIRLLRQYILRISGDFFPLIVAKLVNQLKTIRIDNAGKGLTEASEVALLTEPQNLKACLSSEDIPKELALFLETVRVKITDAFPETFQVVLENFIVLRILGAGIINSVPIDDSHHKALQLLTLTMQKAIKQGQKPEQRLGGLDDFLTQLYAG